MQAAWLGALQRFTLHTIEMLTFRTPIVSKTVERSSCFFLLTVASGQTAARKSDVKRSFEL